MTRNIHSVGHADGTRRLGRLTPVEFEVVNVGSVALAA